MNAIKERLYPLVNPLKKRSDLRNILLLFSVFFNIREDIIGVKVKDTKDEIITEPATTTPNSLNNRPVKPSRKITGINTAVNVIVVARIANIISFEPSIAALRGFIPFSIFV